MNILILTSNYPTIHSPSSGSFVESQVNLLKSRGHSVDVLICNFQKTPRRNPIKSAFSLFLKSKVTLQNQTYLDINYINIGAKIYSQRFEFINTEKIKSYDIIHAHDCIWAGYLTLLIGKKYKINYVVTSHVPFVINNNWLNFKLSYKVLYNSKLIFTVGQQDKNMLSCVLQAERIQLLGNFIDEEIYYPSAKKIKDKFIISSIASTSLRKNIPLFISLIELIKNENKVVKEFKVKLVLAEVPDGINIEQIKCLIEKNGLDDIIELKYNLPQKDILEIYKETDLYVSTSGLETFGMTIAEALSMDIPTVAIKNGASEDFIQLDSGSVFLETEIHDMAQKIIMHINGEITSKESHEYIKSNFGKDAFYTKLMSGYKSIIS
jgi:glycosyltransferase involved in cell wall biosynthesis